MADNNPYQSIMAGIGGATAIGGDIYGAIDRENNINTNISRFEGDGFTRPTLSLGDELGQLSSLREEDAGKGLIGRSIATGATTGLGIGATAGAGVFSLPGAAIGTAAGAIGGLFAGLIGKNVAQNKRDDKVDELGTKIAAEQQSFNVYNRDFFSMQNQRNVFAQLEQRKQNRMYNIPSFSSI